MVLNPILILLDKKGHYIMVKTSARQVAISVLNMYAPDKTASKYFKLIIQ